MVLTVSESTANAVDAVVEQGRKAAAEGVASVWLAQQFAYDAVAFVPGVVTDDVDTARREAAEQLAFYDQIPSYQSIIERSGVSRAADLVEIGDEKTITAAIGRYFDAGATEVVLTQTGLAGPESAERTLRLLGELNRERSAPAGRRAQ